MPDDRSGPDARESSTEHNATPPPSVTHSNDIPAKPPCAPGDRPENWPGDGLSELLKAQQAAIEKAFSEIDLAVDECYKSACDKAPAPQNPSPAQPVRPDRPQPDQSQPNGAQPNGPQPDGTQGAGPSRPVAQEPEGMVTIDAERGPLMARAAPPKTSPPKTRLAASSGKGAGGGTGGGSGGGSGTGGVFHTRLGPIDFTESLKAGISAVRKNLMVVMIFTIASNFLVLAIPIYLFQISDRILTSRSIDTLIMLTLVIVGAVILQAVFDAIRRFILMRTAVEVAAQLGSPILSAAARASLHGSGREYQTLGDLQQVRSFLVSRTLLSFLDAPIAPVFVVAIYLIHPHLGWIVVLTAVVLLVLTLLNQRATAVPFGEANTAQSKANLHLESMSRNSQIINALAMIPEAVQIWGRDTASSLKSQVIAQDRNIVFAALSRGVRLLTQVAMLGWGAFLAIEGEITGGMVIAASIIAGRALAPIEGAIEGWNQYSQSRAAYGRITALLKASPLNFERLQLPQPEGRLDVERLLYVPQGTKRVVLNGISFALSPGDSLAIIGNSGAGKTTLGKMLVGSILPTSGNVRLDLMDLRNWDQRQFGVNIGYLPQDVQLFPGTIKANIARMRGDATDEQIYQAAKLADVHEMIATLPHGYETMVAADGTPLSGGQKQRIALARAFFGNPRMVILDEPNSNLDSAGDAALIRALEHARQQKITVATITQRPALLSGVDKILLLVNGTVALFGKRQEVLGALASRGISIEAGSFGHQLQ
ncbi:type I secretion system permease/ATPase [Aquamicrobium segne]|uniref:Type I secretion system permease/ATPase n=1 Tax=Aquamicrobium segne TaxID=469547 RepID=A0ABW0H069_9HYPH